MMGVCEVGTYLSACLVYTQAHMIFTPHVKSPEHEYSRNPFLFIPGWATYTRDYIDFLQLFADKTGRDIYAFDYTYNPFFHANSDGRSLPTSQKEKVRMVASFIRDIQQERGPTKIDILTYSEGSLNCILALPVCDESIGDLFFIAPAGLLEPIGRLALIPRVLANGLQKFHLFLSSDSRTRRRLHTHDDSVFEWSRGQGPLTLFLRASEPATVCVYPLLLTHVQKRGRKFTVVFCKEDRLITYKKIYDTLIRDGAKVILLENEGHFAIYHIPEKIVDLLVPEVCA